MSDTPLEVKSGSLAVTAMRYHELCLQRWLNSRFFVREGYPIPVVFATPMDAFSQFSKLWQDENNPFKYLLDAKDADGVPMYQPYPEPVRYPLLSVMRRGLSYRPSQNYSTHSWRRIGWPTVSDAGPVVPGKEQIGTGLVKEDLGNVLTSRMPMAFDFKFQIDHFCMRPDTQAFFVERLMRQFWRTGGSLQSWIEIDYPGWGPQYVRCYLDGDIDQSAPDDADSQNKHVEFRTSFTFVIEGYDVDIDYVVKPALWTLVIGSASQEELESLTRPVLAVDLRVIGSNLVLDSRTNVPASGTVAAANRLSNYYAAGTGHISMGDPNVPVSVGDNVVSANHHPVILPTDAIILPDGYTHGIAPGTVFGQATFSGTL